MTYTFTSDWFTPHIPSWTTHLARFAGRADLRYLEVGVYEGRSLLWMLEHILTADSARATAVDGFYANPRDYESTFRANLAASGQAAKVSVAKGDSDAILRGLAPDSQDLVYIDGSHLAKRVFLDLALAWPLVKVDGLIILDDYRVDEGLLPPELRPQPVIDVFLEAFANELEVVARGYQVIVRRTEAVRSQAHAGLDYNARNTSTELDAWTYFWPTRRLLHRDGEGEIPLTPLELRALEALLRRPRLRRLAAKIVALRARR